MEKVYCFNCLWYKGLKDDSFLPFMVSSYITPKIHSCRIPQIKKEDNFLYPEHIKTWVEELDCANFNSNNDCQNYIKDEYKKDNR